MESLLSTYFVQPDCIPDDISGLVAQQLPDEKILAYTYVDLDGKRRYDSRWLIATQHHLAKASLPPSGPAVWELKVTPYSAIQSIEILEGVSSDRLFVTGVDKMLLDEIFYTRRQSRAAGQVKFVAEQRIKLVREPGKAAHALSENLDAHRDYREGILQAVNDAKALLVMPKMGVIARLLSYLKPYKGRMAVALGFAMLLTLIQLLPPWLTRVAIDNVMRPLEKGANPSAGKLLWLIIGSLAVIWMLGELLQFVRLRVMALVGEKVARDLRSGIYAHMQKLSLSFFSQRQTGSLITRVSSDSDRLWDFVTFGILDIITAVLQIIGVAVALFLQDRSLAFLVIMPLPFMGLMFYYHGKNMQGLFTRIWRKWSAMTAVLSDVIPGIRVVKAFAQENHEVDRFERRNRAVEQEASQLHREWTRFWPTVMVLMHTCSLIVWVVGAPRVMQHMLSGGKEGMPLGVFIAFTGYMWMFWGPVQQLGMMSRMINRVTTSAARIFEVLDTVPTVVTNDHPVALERIDGKITFENVVFSYDGIRNALKGVSFDVHAGEMIGLVGPSGGVRQPW